MGFEVETRSLAGRSTAVGSAGPFTLIVDRAAAAGGGGLGFNGGQLLNLAVAGCVSNDLFREAALRGIALDQVVVRVDCDYEGKPAVSSDISYSVELSGKATQEELRELVTYVDSIAEIPNSIRNGTKVVLGAVEVS